MKVQLKVKEDKSVQHVEAKVKEDIFTEPIPPEMPILVEDMPTVEPEVTTPPEEYADLEQTTNRAIDEALASIRKPLDTRELLAKLSHIHQTQEENRQKVTEILDRLSIIDEKELELLDLMIKKYKRTED